MVAKRSESEAIPDDDDSPSTVNALDYEDARKKARYDIAISMRNVTFGNNVNDEKKSDDIHPNDFEYEIDTIFPDFADQLTECDEEKEYDIPKIGRYDPELDEEIIDDVEEGSENGTAILFNPKEAERVSNERKKKLKKVHFQWT